MIDGAQRMRRLDRKAQDEGEDGDQDLLELCLLIPSSHLTITYFSDPTLTLESWKDAYKLS